MIQITPQMKILLATEPIDFRKGIDGICGICRNVLKQDPFSGVVFLFCNRNQSSLKVLVYDGQGFWLCLKRLSKGRLKWWPKRGDLLCELAAHEVQILLWNGDPQFSSVKMWKKIA